MKCKVKIIDIKLDDDLEQSLEKIEKSHETLNDSMDFDIDCKSEDQEQETNSKEVKTYRVTSSTRLLVKTLITVNSKESD